MPLRSKSGKMVGNRNSSRQQLLILDRKVLRAIAVLYIIYALSGIVTLAFGVHTVEGVGGWLYQIICTGGFSLVAALTAFFLLKGYQFAEIVSTFTFIGIILVLIISYIIVTIDGNVNTAPLIVLSLAYTVMPIWRMDNIIRKR